MAKLRVATALASSVVFGALVSATAHAADTFLLTNPNSDLSPFNPTPEPYGAVVIQLIDPTHATIIFVANGLDPNNQAFVFLDGGAFAMNFSQTIAPITAADVTLFNNNLATNGTGFNPPTLDASKLDKAGQEDGFGNINHTISLTDSFHAPATRAVIHVVDTGTPWATTADVLTPNTGANGGFDVAAHMGVCNDTTSLAFSCNQSAGAINTGFVAKGGTPTPGTITTFSIIPVPEPASLALLGTGLLGLGAIRRLLRRR